MGVKNSDTEIFYDVLERIPFEFRSENLVVPDPKGTKRFWKVLLDVTKNNASLFYISPSKEGVQEVKKVVRERSLDSLVSCQVGSLDEMPVADPTSYDWVVFNSLSRSSDPASSLNRAYELAKKGIIVIEPLIEDTIVKSDYFLDVRKLLMDYATLCYGGRLDLDPIDAFFKPGGKFIDPVIQEFQYSREMPFLKQVTQRLVEAEKLTAETAKNWLAGVNLEVPIITKVRVYYGVKSNTSSTPE